MPNRLMSATSPYLLQHADNPVDWWEWGEDAFEEARRWHSDDAGCVLEESVEGLILARIAELSTPAAHGQSLVADALAAIAASRFGLSDSEMAEALSQGVRSYDLAITTAKSR